MAFEHDMALDTSEFKELLGMAKDLLKTNDDLQKQRTKIHVDGSEVKKAKDNYDELINDIRSTKRTKVEILNSSVIQKDITRITDLMDTFYDKITSKQKDLNPNQTKSFLQGFKMLELYSNEFGVDLKSKYQKIFDEITGALNKTFSYQLQPNKMVKHALVETSELQSIYDEAVKEANKKFKYNIFSGDFEATEKLIATTKSKYKEEIDTINQANQQEEDIQRQHYETMLDMVDTFKQRLKDKFKSISEKQYYKIKPEDLADFAEFQDLFQRLLDTMTRYNVEVGDLQNDFNNIQGKIYSPTEHIGETREGVEGLAHANSSLSESERELSKETEKTSGEMTKAYANIFDSKLGEKFISLLENIEKHLNNLKTTLGTIDESKGMKNLISTFDTLLTKLDNIRGKIGTGVYNVEINSEGSYGSSTDKILDKTLSDLRSRYEKAVNAFGGEDQMFGRFGLNAERLQNLYSKSSVNELQDVKLQIDRIREFFKEFRTLRERLELEIEQSKAVLNDFMKSSAELKKMSITQIKKKVEGYKENQNNPKPNVYEVEAYNRAMGIKEQETLLSKLNKITAPAKTNARLNANISKMQEAETEEYKKLQELSKTDLSGVIEALTNIEKLLETISTKEFFNKESMDNFITKLDNIIIKFDDILSKIKTINNTPIDSTEQSVDKNNVVYHAGVVSKLNKAESNGQFVGSRRDTGYYGTGHYFVDANTKHELDNNGYYNKLPYTSVDISKYKNLFKADTDKKANDLHNFLKNLTRYTQGSDTYNVDELFSQFEDVFGKSILSIEDFKIKLDSLKSFMEQSSLEDRSDSVSTQFMKSLGYGGVDTRGTKYADTRYGTVIYDLKEESILQANITDELEKQGDMLERRNYAAGEVWDKNEDTRIQGIIDAQQRRKEYIEEYKKLYDVDSGDKISNELEDAENRIREIDKIIADCTYSIENAEEETRDFYEMIEETMGLDMTPSDEEFKNEVENKKKSYQERIDELKEERAEIEATLPLLEEKNRLESEKQTAAYEQAKRNVDARHAELKQQSPAEIDKATKSIIAEGKAAQEASKKKQEFAQANKEVARSAENTAISVDKATQSIKTEGDIAENGEWLTIEPDWDNTFQKDIDEYAKDILPEEEKLEQVSSRVAQKIADDFGATGKTIALLKDEVKALLKEMQLGENIDLSNIVNVLENSSQVLNKYKKDYDLYYNVRDYVSKSKIKVSSHDAEEFGDEWSKVRGTIGLSVLNNTSGSDAESFIRELTEQYGDFLGEVNSTQDALRKLYDFLKNPPDLKKLFKEDLNNGLIELLSDRINAGIVGISNNSLELSRKNNISQEEPVNTSSNSIDSATKSIKAEGDVAEVAAEKKEKFVNANEKVANSSTNTASATQQANEAIKTEGEVAEETADKINKAESALERYIRRQQGSADSGNYAYTEAINQIVDKRVINSTDEDGNPLEPIEQIIVNYDKLSKSLIKSDTDIFKLEQKIKDTQGDTSGLQENLNMLKEKRKVYEDILDLVIKDSQYEADASQATILNNQRNQNLQWLQNIQKTDESVKKLKSDAASISLGFDKDIKNVELVDFVDKLKDLGVYSSEAQKKATELSDILANVTTKSGLSDFSKQFKIFRQDMSSAISGAMLDEKDNENLIKDTIRQQESAYKNIWNIKTQIAKLDKRKDSNLITELIQQEREQRRIYDLKTKELNALDQEIAKQQQLNSITSIRNAGKNAIGIINAKQADKGVAEARQAQYEQLRKESAKRSADAERVKQNEVNALLKKQNDAYNNIWQTRKELAKIDQNDKTKQTQIAKLEEEKQKQLDIYNITTKNLKAIDANANADAQVNNLLKIREKTLREINLIEARKTDKGIAEAEKQRLAYYEKLKKLSAERIANAKKEKQAEVNNLLDKQVKVYSDIWKTKKKISELNPETDKNEIAALEKEKREHQNLYLSISKRLKLSSVSIDYAKQMNRLVEARKSSEYEINRIQGQQADAEVESRFDSIISKYKEIMKLQSQINSLKSAGISDNDQTITVREQAIVALEKEIQATQTLGFTKEQLLEIDKAEAASRQVVADAQAKQLVRDAKEQQQIEKTRVALQKQAAQLTTNGKLMKSYGDRVNQIIKELENTGIAKDRLEQLRLELTKIATEANLAGKSGKTFGQILKQRFTALGAYIGTFASFYRIIAGVRKAFSTITELDTQLVDLRKTTKMNTEELNEFYYSANNIAKQMGVTTSEIISQAAAWSRLGYNTKEASEQMAQLSSQFTSISPGMTTDNATDYLVSTMKAFGLKTEEVERQILDNVNAVGNAFATTNAEIGEMLTRSSAAMKEANNTLEQTIALETAAVQITRNAETTGTAFRTNKNCPYVQKCA